MIKINLLHSEESKTERTRFLHVLHEMILFRFRETILAKAGTISMREVFREFRSRDPSYEHYIERLTTRF